MFSNIACISHQEALQWRVSDKFLSNNSSIHTHETVDFINSPITHPWAYLSKLAKGSRKHIDHILISMANI